MGIGLVPDERDSVSMGIGFIATGLHHFYKTINADKSRVGAVFARYEAIASATNCEIFARIIWLAEYEDVLLCFHEYS
jgi:hypothetical protein